jgi:hypothetical protein
MNTRHPSRWFWFSLVALIAVPFLAESIETQVPSSGIARASAETASGLVVVTFDVAPGKIVVNLPDDIRAGDTISGTVVADPKGSTPEERSQNKTQLEGIVLDLGGTKISAKQPRFTWTSPFPHPNSRPRYLLRIIPVSGVSGDEASVTIPVSSPDAVKKPGDKAANVNSNENANSRGANVNNKNANTGMQANPSETKMVQPFIIPPLGQAGRPVTVTGPFDGDSSNTSLSGGFELIAESPRKAVFRAPTDTTGPTEIQLHEGNTQTTGHYRNVGVNLSAPKTNLMKGESTSVTIQVTGLQGITEPVPLHLVKTGVVNMQGGDVQTASIRPSDIGSDGTFTMTRTITGQQTGGFNLTATVVVFNTCLQDDGNGNLIRINWDTGDYLFCQSPGTAGTNPIVLSTFEPYIGGTLLPIEEHLEVKTTGPIWFVRDTPDGLIHINFDPSNYSGQAIIRVPTTKQRFTITDRDTRNNICVCK